MVLHGEVPRPPLVRAVVLLAPTLAESRADPLGEVDLRQRVLERTQRLRRQVHHEVLVVRHAPSVHPLGLGCQSLREGHVPGARALQGVHVADLVAGIQEVVEGVRYRGRAEGVANKVEGFLLATEALEGVEDALLHGLVVHEEALLHLAALAALSAKLGEPERSVQEAVQEPGGALDGHEAARGLHHLAHAGGRVRVVAAHKLQARSVHLGTVGDGVADVPPLEAVLAAVDGLLQAGHRQRVRGVEGGRRARQRQAQEREESRWRRARRHRCPCSP
mmetsp:Transcript_99144/g.309024  ORF Transcript_99144/g.309024 Transcript_99144/m.309024 type:complete len:277 (+) Transcript_99144:169-999(+)